jgi:hypothetical protein
VTIGHESHALLTSSKNMCCVVRVESQAHGLCAGLSLSIFYVVPANDTPVRGRPSARCQALLLYLIALQISRGFDGPL